MATLEQKVKDMSLKDRPPRRPRDNAERAKEQDLVSTRQTSGLHVDEKQGKTGSAVGLTSNYFGFDLKHDYKLFHYRIDMSPDLDHPRAKKRVMSNIKDTLPTYIFDGGSMFTTNPVYQHQDALQLEKVSFQMEQGSEEKVPVKIIFRLVGELHPTDVNYLQFYNILLKSTLEGLELVPLGRNMFDKMAAKTIQGYPLEVWPGYVTSIRQHEREPLLCVEVANKMLRTDTVMQQMRHIRQQGRGGGVEGMKKALIGTIVMTRYNNNTYRIDDILFDENALTTFEKGGTQITFKEYYESKYNIKITDPKQPLLVSMPKDRDRRGGRPERVKLLPELCHMTGLSDDQRADFRLMKELAVYTRMEPNNRVQAITDFARRLNTTQRCVDALKRWDVKLKPNMVQLTGRQLAVEPIRLRNSTKLFSYAPKEADWTRATFSKEYNGLLSVIPIKNWHCVYPAQYYGQVEAFERELRNACPGLNVEYGSPEWIEVPRDHPSVYMDAIKGIVAGKGSSMIMVVLPNEKSDAYNMLKKFLCVDCPTPSQVITFSKVLKKEKGYRSIATKVIIQMEVKLGGSPWSVKIPLKGCMFVGFDTYHSTFRKGQSVGALVATVDKNYTRYFTTTSFHETGTEMSDEISSMMMKAIENYMKVNNGEAPGKIFFYRDGVGDGQLAQVNDHEVSAIRRKLDQHFKENKPKLAFLVVSKRINTRFFIKDGNRYANPLPGVVVDDIVTLPERHDFFLVPQAVGQGTVNPTGFNILFDEMSTIKTDHHQQLAYKLCHLYYNWPGTVRVPAPCQYAHKIAYLVGENINSQTSPVLNELLFYL